jgi:hypothetical protein
MFALPNSIPHCRTMVLVNAIKQLKEIKNHLEYKGKNKNCLHPQQHEHLYRKSSGISKATRSDELAN